MNVARGFRQEDAWSAAYGGVRGSTSLIAGSLLLALGALLNLAGVLAGGPPGDGPVGAVIAAWIVWILGLAVSGWGLTWIGIGPVLSRLGLVVGLAHGVHAAVLVLALFAAGSPPLPPEAFVAARLLLLAGFAWAEARWLGAGPARALAAVALLQAAKVGLRAGGLLPEFGPPGGPLLDTALNVALAAVVMQAALRVRQTEDGWARGALDARGGGLEEFDNPDHRLPRRP